MFAFEKVFCFSSWKRKSYRKMAQLARADSCRAILDRLPPVSLSDEEIRDVNSVWGQLGLKLDLDIHRLMKAWGYFDARVVAFPLKFLINPILVPNDYYKVMSHKSLAALLYDGKIRMPKIVVAAIDSVCYDQNGEHIPYEAALDALHGSAFFVKPSIGTYGGMGAHRVEAGMPKDKIAELLKGYNGNFLACEILRQHPEIAFANPTSVNTLRLNTLWLNGRISVVSALFRYGQNGAVVDNLGSGGNVLTVTEQGEILPIVITDNAFRFGKIEERLVEKYGMRYPFFDVAAKYACEMHERHFPLAKTIPWDIAIDEEGRPVVIEINLGNSGIIMCEPVFGSRTQEVIDYVKPRLHWLFAKHRPDLNLEYSIYEV